MTAVTDADAIEALDWDHSEPCSANEGTCGHDAVAIVLLRGCDRHPVTKGWLTACQKHLDLARANNVLCTGCKQHLALIDFKYL